MPPAFRHPCTLTLFVGDFLSGLAAGVPTCILNTGILSTSRVLALDRENEIARGAPRMGGGVRALEEAGMLVGRREASLQGCTQGKNEESFQERGNACVGAGRVAARSGEAYRAGAGRHAGHEGCMQCGLGQGRAGQGKATPPRPE